jgi:glycerol uptake facilitator-like aquaporin
MWSTDIIIEFIGTIIFMSAVLLSGGHPIAVGLSLGLVVLFGGLLGCRSNNFNPAVSIALLAKGSIQPLRCATYVLAQILGAIIALYLTRERHASWIYLY